MAIVVFEKISSRELTEDRSAVFQYQILEATGPAEALDAMKAEAPSGFESLFRSIFNIVPIFVNADNISENLWEGTVEYAAFERILPSVVGETFYSFDTSGGQTHITQALEHINSTVETGKCGMSW